MWLFILLDLCCNITRKLWFIDCVNPFIIFFLPQVLAEFEARGANTRNLSDNELRALFEKKITKNPKFKVHKDRVKLVK